MPTTTGTFTCPPNGKILLTTIIGDAQVAGIAVDAFDPDTKASQQLYAGKPVHNEPLGSAADLTGKTLLINARVKDIRPETDWTSVTLILAVAPGHTPPQTYPSPPTKAKPRGSVTHTFIITLEVA